MQKLPFASFSQSHKNHFFQTAINVYLMAVYKLLISQEPDHTIWLVVMLSGRRTHFDALLTSTPQKIQPVLY